MRTLIQGVTRNGLSRGRVLPENVDTLCYTTWDCKYKVE